MKIAMPAAALALALMTSSAARAEEASPPPSATPTATAAPVDAAAKAAKAAECSKQADGIGLQGRERRKFLRECKKGAVIAPLGKIVA